MQNEVTSQHLSLTVELKKPRQILQRLKRVIFQKMLMIVFVFFVNLELCFVGVCLTII